MRTGFLNRRTVLAGATTTVAILAAPAVLAQAITRNVAGFKIHNWEDHFDAIGVGILLSDTVTRVLQHWTPDGEMRVYPTSVPLTDE